ncbi:unnamed protein product [Vicia faba]|uniref:Uncharacterized protein n=1 Tax=Vicia faba TaxID=3906 RepID=A0AAV1A3M1_VICFA|nr:unnamed protein product [Vicia faba]
MFVRHSSCPSAIHRLPTLQTNISITFIVFVPISLRFTIENYDHYDSNDVRCRDSDTSDAKSDYALDDNNSVSSAFQSSDDGDGDDNSHNTDSIETNAVVGDRKVNINVLTADEIRAMEFSTVDEANEFYFKYGKCKGFSIRKSDVRTKGTNSGDLPF